MALAATRRGSALMSETLNSNSINLAVGITLAGALGSLVFVNRDIFNISWLLGMTAVAVALFGRHAGGGRVADPRDRERSEEEEPHERGRAPLEEGWGGMFHPRVRTRAPSSPVES